jgi:hypothetical protein
MRWWAREGFDEFDMVDPLLLDRPVPVEDAEVDRMETLCRAATPGSLVMDDQSDGGGELIATLPDGRLIVSERGEVLGDEEHRASVEANAQLICRARSIVLRMVHDRRCWRQREQQMLQRIEELERQLGRDRVTEDGSGQGFPRRPR